MSSINVLDLIELARRHAVRVAAWGLSVSIAAYLIALLVPPTYRASAVILPPDEDELSSMLSPARRNLSALGGLGRLGGQYFTQADIALAVLRSRRMAESVVDKFELRRQYKVKSKEAAIRVLRGSVRIALATDGTIAVTASDNAAERSAAIANFFIQELDRYNREFRSFRARRTRQFLEDRVAEVDSTLRAAESSLASYQRGRGSIVFSPEGQGGMASIANLVAQKTIAEVDLELARQYAPSSEETRRLEARVRELRRQVGEAPQTQVGGAGLLRSVALHQQVLILLTSQLEESRIREVMDTPTVQVLDPATPPEIPSWPRKSWFAALGGLLGVAIGLALSRGGRSLGAPTAPGSRREP